MLNEILEYMEYTCALDGTFPKRLSWGNIAKGFSGIPRALTVIARHAYYVNGMDTGGIDYLLNLWCGFENDEEKNKLYAIDRNLSNWLPRYIERLEPSKSRRPKDEIEKTRKAMLSTLDGNKNKWNRKVFQKEGGVNDKHSIYFDRIIADAINEGPLRERCLILKKDPVSGTSKRENYINDQGLKLVSAFLIGQIADSEYSNVNFPDIANWLETGGSEGKKVNAIIDNLRYNLKKEKNVRIFNTEYMQNNAEKYLRLNKEWIELYGSRLGEKNDLTSLDKKEFIYEDAGCMKALQRIN